MDGFGSSLDRPFVRKEVGWARKYNKPIITVYEQESWRPGHFDYQTVMQSGETLWLSPAGRRWDKVDSDKLVEEAERQRAEEARKRRVARSRAAHNGL